MGYVDTICAPGSLRMRLWQAFWVSCALICAERWGHLLQVASNQVLGRKSLVQVGWGVSSGPDIDYLATDALSWTVEHLENPCHSLCPCILYLERPLIAVHHPLYNTLSSNPGLRIWKYSRFCTDSIGYTRGLWSWDSQTGSTFNVPQVIIIAGWPKFATLNRYLGSDESCVESEGSHGSGADTCKLWSSCCPNLDLECQWWVIGKT